MVVYSRDILYIILGIMHISIISRARRTYRHIIPLHEFWLVSIILLLVQIEDKRFHTKLHQNMQINRWTLCVSYSRWCPACQKKMPDIGSRIRLIVTVMQIYGNIQTLKVWHYYIQMINFAAHVCTVASLKYNMFSPIHWLFAWMPVECMILKRYIFIHIQLSLRSIGILRLTGTNRHSNVGCPCTSYANVAKKYSCTLCTLSIYSSSNKAK